MSSLVATKTLTVWMTNGDKAELSFQDEQKRDEVRDAVARLVI